MKIFTRVLAVLAITGWTGVANASLMDYEFNGTDFTGGFSFNDTTNIFSGVSIFETSFGLEDWTALTGDATGASGLGNIFPLPLELIFTDNLGSLDLGDTYAVSWAVDATNTDAGELFRGTTSIVETSAAAPVPAPATLALFGLGLAGLGWSRRKKA